MSSTIAMASSLGQVLFQIRLPVLPFWRLGASSSASRPLISPPAFSTTGGAGSCDARSSPARADGYLMGMTGHLRAQPIGDLGGLGRDLGRVDAPGALVG